MGMERGKNQQPKGQTDLLYKEINVSTVNYDTTNKASRSTCPLERGWW